MQAVLNNSFLENVKLKKRIRRTYKNIKKSLMFLYEDLVTFDFNTSMLEMRKEVEDIRNQKI
ncbi:hypothetical protein [Lebetimonas sp. JS138]|uniref:hypothetical protein n=1 Tax=Lebetimonas sp. JS138 TaxID=990072 RepID=UPI0004637877|nr:hypothetical protein [Lebetimonas sp. JS138]